MTTNEYYRQEDLQRQLAGLRARNAELCFLLGAVIGGIINRYGTLQGVIDQEMMELIDKAVYLTKEEGTR